MITDYTHRIAALAPIATATQRKNARRLARFIWSGQDVDDDNDKNFGVPLSLTGTLPATHYGLDGAITGVMAARIIANANRVVGIRWCLYDAFSHQMIHTHAGPWVPKPVVEGEPDPNTMRFAERVAPLKVIEAGV